MGDFADVNDAELTFDEMMSLSREEVKGLLGEFEAYKEERARFQEAALITLPDRPPLVLDCIHYLRANGGIQTEGIFRVNGDSHAVDTIKRAFTKNVDLNDVLLSAQQELQLKNYDVATALKSYFRLLRDPLVPTASYEAMKEVTEGQVGQGTVDSLREIIYDMQEPNKSILAFTMMFFQEIVQNQEVNKMSANNLATCLTMSITRFIDNGGTGAASHFAAMMEVGNSTKIIAIMLNYMDFTEFITPHTYYDFLDQTSYKRELLPETFAEFLNSDLFTRFAPRYEEAVRHERGPPPVPGRRNKQNKFLNP